MERYIHTEYGHVYYDLDSFAKPVVYNLFVKPEFRRKGKAQELLKLVKTTIQDKCLSGIEIMIEAAPFDNCEVSRECLEKLYTVMGFTLITDNKWERLASEGSDAAHPPVR